MSPSTKKPGTFDWDRVLAKAERGVFFGESSPVTTYHPQRDGQLESNSALNQGE